MKDIEKTKTSKADLVAAVKNAVAYCNKALDSMTDAKGSQMVKLFNFEIAKLTLFALNTAHTDEHYRPPTSENPPGQRTPGPFCFTSCIATPIIMGINTISYGINTMPLMFLCARRQF
jgi:hypothetical protein